MKKKFLIASLFILFSIFFLYLAGLVYSFFQESLVPHHVEKSIKVYPNQDIHALIKKLVAEKVIRHPTLFIFIANVTGDNLKLRFGEYRIDYPMTAWHLLQHMTTGTGLVRHRITIVDGWTFQTMRETLFGNLNLNQTLMNKTNQQIMQQLQSSQKNPEGLFYPDTYFFTWGNTDFSILKTAYQKMQTILQNDWQNRALNLPYKNAYEALIAASLIERETSVDVEKPLIASVILNRLQKNMRLQIDPTVQYGVDQKFDTTITKKALAQKTDYNTYQINGLPPTPICMPSQSSIYAALHPANTNYLYYVATGNGGHNFSTTLTEHEKQVAAYREVQTRNQESGIRMSK